MAQNVITSDMLIRLTKLAWERACVHVYELQKCLCCTNVLWIVPLVLPFHSFGLRNCTEQLACSHEVALQKTCCRWTTSSSAASLRLVIYWDWNTVEMAEKLLAASWVTIHSSYHPQQLRSTAVTMHSSYHAQQLPSTVVTMHSSYHPQQLPSKAVTKPMEHPPTPCRHALVSSNYDQPTAC